MFAIVLDRDIKSWPQIDYTDPSLSNGISGGGQITNIGKYGEAKDLAIVLQTGALPYVFKQLEQSQVSATLGKDSLKQAKIAAAIGLLVVALFLLLFYRFLGVVAVIGLGIYAAFLYGVILLLNVTLTLPGFAGPDPDDRRRRRRERRHLRTHQGRGARREVRARGDQRRLLEGLPHDRRRERRHRDHGARAVRGRDRGREGLRADAADRHRALAGHGGRRDARDARPARRLPLVRQPGVHGRERPAERRAGSRSTSWPKRRYLWFAISGGRDRRSASSRSPSRASTSASTSRAARRSRSRRREYVSLATVRDQTASIGQSDAVVQGRGSSQRRHLQDASRSGRSR